MADRRRAGSSNRRVTDFVNSAVEQSMLLPIGAVAGLLWANLHLASYARFTGSLQFLVNDVGMVFFFALAAKEVVEAVAAGGALNSPAKAATPVVAALGGMIGPAAVYLVLVHLTGESSLARGWAVPCATDIAFSYLVARVVFGAGHPAIPFLLLLAIADDAFGLVVLAVFYPAGPPHLGEFALLFPLALLLAFTLRWRGVRSPWPYVLVAGALSWIALLRGGFHPALALVPIVPFLPRALADPGLFVAAPAEAHDALSELEHRLKRPVEFVLLVFGLVNAGVPLGSAGPGTWCVLLAVLVGKPLGIVAATLLGRATGLRLPAGVEWKDLIVVGFTAAIGFTVALFFATAAFPPGPVLDQVKTGALLSVAGAVLAAISAVVLRAGRWGEREGGRD